MAEQFGHNGRSLGSQGTYSKAFIKNCCISNGEKINNIPSVELDINSESDSLTKLI